MYSVAGLALSGMMFLTVADVLLRAFRRPIVGTYELVGLLGAVVIGFAIPQTSRLNGHVYMDFLTGKFSPQWSRILHFITRTIAIFVFVIIGWNLWLLGDDFKKMGEVTLTLQVPLYPIPYGIAVCCFIECLVLFVDMLAPRKDDGEQ